MQVESRVRDRAVVLQEIRQSRLRMLQVQLAIYECVLISRDHIDQCRHTLARADRLLASGKPPAAVPRAV